MAERCSECDRIMAVMLTAKRGDIVSINKETKEIVYRMSEEQEKVAAEAVSHFVFTGHIAWRIHNHG